MTGFNRRSLIKATVATGTALCMPGSLSAAAKIPGVFVVDRRFAASTAAALERAALGTMVIDPRQDDLGIAWRNRIPKWLENHGRLMEGVTLWADLVICEAFARENRMTLVRPPQPVHALGAPGLQRWAIS